MLHFRLNPRASTSDNPSSKFLQGVLLSGLQVWKQQSLCARSFQQFLQNRIHAHTNSFELTYWKFQDLVLARNYASLVCGIEKSFLVLCGHVVPHVC